MFGGSAVQPAQTSYLALPLTASIALVWPPQAPTGLPVAARIMDVTPSGPGFNLAMPPANQTSAGWDCLVTNRGASSFNVVTSLSATVIATIAPGQQYYLYLTNPTTQDGVWAITLFGSGSSTLSASAVAGVGLLAIGATLSPNFVTSTTSSTPVTLSATSDRSAQYVWTGGAGVFNLPALASIPLPDGYFVTINNKGTGTLTITPNGVDPLDGVVGTEAMNPGFAATFFGSASGWYSFGPLATTKFNFTELVQTVTGGTLTLTPTQAANVVQKYQGALVSNQIVVFPPTVQVYYVQNATTGAFTLTFKSGAGTVVVVPTGQNAILFSDGVNVVNASNITGSFGSITLNSGTAASPALSFSGDTTTGIYLPASGQLGFTVGGVLRGEFIGGNFVLGNSATVFQPWQAASPLLQIYATTANTAATTVGEYSSVFSGAGPGYTVVRSHGATVGAQGAIVNGDGLGGFFWAASDGTNLLQAASITAAAISNYTAGSAPSVLNFGVNPGGGVVNAASMTSVLFSASAAISAVTTITAGTQFIGAGTGLTGTAAAFNIGGNAATATLATNATNATNATTATTATTANALNTGNAYTINGLTNNGTTTLAGTFTNSAQSNFLATRITSAQTFGTVAIFNSASTNVGGNYSTSTGVYTVPRNGVYSFTAGLGISNGSAGVITAVAYMLVGSIAVSSTFNGYTTIPVSAVGQQNMAFTGFLAAGTTVSVNYNTGFTGNVTMNITSISNSFFSGAQLF